MSNISVILVLISAIVSCTLSSYLDIPPPPERPIRFKSKEQIETYLKAVKDYYDAFKIKLVRRDHLMQNPSWNIDQSSSTDEDYKNEQFNESSDLIKPLSVNHQQRAASRHSNRLRRAINRI